ncbi:unnamed protein product, partial [Anisakis simplex]|uniref:Uncharacterized protein n=1 Tax=Anisakis simplex TaxID=6269 RepID=A0A0M3JF35_ANISI
MEAVSVPAAGNGLDDWVTTPSATDMLEKETSEAMASPPEESPLKESAAPIQPRSVEPQQMRISSDSENGFVKVY